MSNLLKAVPFLIAVLLLPATVFAILKALEMGIVTSAYFSNVALGNYAYWYLPVFLLIQLANMAFVLFAVCNKWPRRLRLTLISLGIFAFSLLPFPILNTIPTNYEGTYYIEDTAHEISWKYDPRGSEKPGGSSIDIWVVYPTLAPYREASDATQPSWRVSRTALRNDGTQPCNRGCFIQGDYEYHLHSWDSGGVILSYEEVLQKNWPSDEEFEVLVAQLFDSFEVQK